MPALKNCTAAGTSCGSCVPLLKQLLEAEGVEQSQVAVRTLRATRAPSCSRSSRPPSIRTFSGLIERYGTGTGCDICKPVVASILASTSSDHILDGEQASLQDSNDHFLANIQRNGSYSVVPRVPGGDITPDQLILIGEIARDFGLYTKITGGQRIDMFGATGRPAAGDLAQARRRWHGVRARVRQVAAHREELRRAATGAATANRIRCRWPSTSSCATGDCAPRTRSRWVSRGVPASAPRRGARTSASSPPRPAGTSTSAATAA